MVLGIGLIFISLIGFIYGVKKETQSFNLDINHCVDYHRHYMDRLFVSILINSLLRDSTS